MIFIFTILFSLFSVFTVLSGVLIRVAENMKCGTIEIGFVFLGGSEFGFKISSEGATGAACSA